MRGFMDFERFVLARDFIYLAALLLGAGIGCMLNRFKRSAGRRFRNISVTLGFCFFSGTCAALTAAIIYSNWLIFSETSLYYPLGILTVLIILAFRFPKAVGFPLFIATGFLIVWIGYTCLRFPAVDGLARGRVIRDGNGLVQIELTYPAGKEPGASLSIQSSADILEFKIRCFSLSGNFPIIGGIKRGIITEISDINGSFYKNPHLDWIFPSGKNSRQGPGSGFSESFGWLISYWEISGLLRITDLLPGVALMVLLEDSTIIFR